MSIVDSSATNKSSCGVSPRNQLNDLTAREWVSETVSVWTQRGLGADHPDAKIEKQHPAPFSFTDVRRLVRFFTKERQIVLDPFVGVGSTLKACAIEGRRGIGIELNPHYVALANKRLRTELSLNSSDVDKQIIMTGDSRELVDTFDENSVDFIVTSPPYWRILHKQDHKVKQERLNNHLETRYSDDARDLGNIESYEDFLSQVSSILGKTATALRQNKYMAVVVGDFRDKGTYYMFHADLGMKLKEYRLMLKGITILYQRHKRVYPYGYPAAFVPNFHHQYILILQNQK